MDKFSYLYILFVGVFGWGFFILIMGISIDFPEEIKFLIKQIPCDELKAQSVFLKTHWSKDYVKEECF